VHQGDCLLGRSPECLIVLASEQVSREHAVVRRIHCGLEIEDLGSRNGTWVNGQRIRRPTVLSAGDEVALGEDVLEVVLKPNARAPETVSRVSSSLGEESERQRRTLEQLEYAVSQVALLEDRAGAAVDLRDEIERLLDSAGAWGVVLSPEEMRRLTEVAQRLAEWADDHRVSRWSRDLGERLSRRGPALS
jgi:pSer/pThr/pTyr-binding forkhead associated (FHA) protein